MKSPLLLTTLILISYVSSFSQTGDFPFGKILHDELGMTSYAPDTSASAVVLNEFGKAYFNDEVHIMFERHVKIKILKKEGLDKGNFEVYLFKNGVTFDQNERWVSVKASTFNYDGNTIRESSLDPKKVFIENSNPNFNIVKIALENVKVGSVIEMKYVTESPYYFNFKSWYFQSDIPKVRSEFWASLPANFNYSINLNGFQKLTSANSEVQRNCFLMPGAGSDGQRSAESDCSLSKYVMENVPALKEESYVSSMKNYTSSIHYELSEIIFPDGRKNSFSEEWKDVDYKLKEHEDFGQKIKKAKKIFDDLIPGIASTETDDLKKSNLIYNYINHWYSWNGEENKYASQDVKKCYEKKIGNSADINLALVAALQAAGLNADPVILSTRDNGVPFKARPRRSDFNYVVSSLKIDGKLLLLDATDPLLPFGVLPIKCMNDQGRLVSKDESSWIDLRPTQKYRSATTMNLKLDDDGGIKGNVTVNHFGYSAYDKRTELNQTKNQEDLVKAVSKEWGNSAIENYTIENKDDLTKPLVEKMNIEISSEVSGNPIVYLNPFLTDRYENNPFKSNERLYPVDLGAPIESSYFLTIEVPEKFKVDELPANMALSLPQNGGKCLLNITQMGNKVSLTSILALAKPIYTSDEYHNLKEFFARVVQMQQSQFVFKAK